MISRRTLLAVPLAVAGIPGRSGRPGSAAVPPGVVRAVEGFKAAIARLVEVEAIEDEWVRSGDRDGQWAWYRSTFEPAWEAMRSAEEAVMAELQAAGLAGAFVGGALFASVNLTVTRLDGDQPQHIIEYAPGTIAGLG